MKPPLVGNAALVTGLPAAVLARLATDAHRQGRFDGLPEADRTAVVATIAALHAAAEGWRTAVVGNAATADVDEMPQSRQIDVREAADMLGIKPRQVRNLAPELGGVRVGGRWLLDFDAVTAEAARRAAA